MFLRIFDLIIPPRPTELTVRALAPGALMDIRPTESGALPYHHDAVRALVWEIKYYANRRALALCGALLCEWLMEALEDTLGTPLLIPVPMHPARRRQRGHNQTELLCEAALHALSRKTRSRKVPGGPPLEYAPTVLVRTVHTPPQQGLTERERRRNVKDSMRVVDAARVAGRACIVLDDVSTTGATLHEAARALRHAGARSVTLLALAQS